MPDPSLSTEQRNFLELFGFEVKSIRFLPEGVIKTLAEALEQAGRRTFVLIGRKDQDGVGAPVVDLPISASIDHWMDMTEGLREGYIVTRVQGGIGTVTLTPVKKAP